MNQDEDKKLAEFILNRFDHLAEADKRQELVDLISGFGQPRQEPEEKKEW